MIVNDKSLVASFVMRSQALDRKIGEYPVITYSILLPCALYMCSYFVHVDNPLHLMGFATSTKMATR